jgi:hypothetical protein
LVLPRSSVLAIHATRKFLWTSIPQQVGYTISTTDANLVPSLSLIEEAALTGYPAKVEFGLSPFLEVMSLQK